MSNPENARLNPAPRKRSGGRSARIAQSDEYPSTTPAILTRKTPVYELLDAEQVQALEEHSDWILQEIGVEIKDDEVALLFKEAGAMVEDSRVRFEPGLVRALCKSAPREFQMHARDPAYTITIGGDHVVFAPAYGPPFISDIERGRRYANIEDFRNLVKLTFSTPWLHHSGGTVCEPMDIAVNKRHLDMVYAHLRFSSKPLMGAVTSPERAQDSIDMVRLVFGHKFMENHCVIQGNINVNSPLVFDHTMTGALKTYARANQGVVVTPFILGGAMGPVTQPALIAQAHAEAMVGVAMCQLVRAGTPVVYGSFLTTIDLKTGAPTFGTPEANLSILAIGQLCRRLGVPLRGGGHLTASKVADGQAMQESSDNMSAGLSAGANFVLQAAGWLEGGLTVGYEKFMMDVDRCGMMHHTLAGLNINDNTLAKEAYRQAGPGQNFFGIPHTIDNFATANYRSALADTSSYERWVETGRETIEQRANRRWKQILADYTAPLMDAAVDEALLDFIARKNRAVPDQWY